MLITVYMRGLGNAKMARIL